MVLQADLLSYAKSLVASIQKDIKSLGIGRSGTKISLETFFDVIITEPEAVAATGRLFRNGHYSQAVEEAFKLVNNMVKSRSLITEIDGASLMERAFSPSSPRLKINKLKTSSQRDQQLGYMKILAGCMTGVRNPRAHEHNFTDDPKTALELLALANHLVKMIKKTSRARKLGAKPVKQ